MVYILGLHGKNVRTENEIILKRKWSVTTPPAPLTLTPFFFFLAILTTYFNEFTTIYLSQSNTQDKNKFPLFELVNTIKG